MINFENTTPNYYDWAIGPTIRNNNAVFCIRGGADGFSNLNDLFTVSGNGNVGIGTTSTDNKLTVSGGAIQLSPYDSGTTKFAMYSYNNVFFLNPRNSTGGFDSKEGLTMNPSANVGIGTSNPTSTLYVNGSLFYSSLTGGSSDDRIKKNEVYITNALETISKLKPQKYDKYMTEDSSDNTLQLTDEFIEESGLIAQEVYYDVPELRHLVGVPEDADLSGNPIPTSSDPQMDPDYSNWGSKPAGLNYNGFIAYLIKGMQEQQEQIELLKTEVAALKNA